ncbi:hypothetical protein V6N11_074631 [Hibiscus sabdariffa]|uniref:Uncharacterized protein n=1 Tax=Hibiscus sabdariffa TaxID=183260 RepID=A0ABR2R451_9ROSI
MNACIHTLHCSQAPLSPTDTIGGNRADNIYEKHVDHLDLLTRLLGNGRIRMFCLALSSGPQNPNCSCVFSDDFGLIDIGDSASQISTGLWGGSSVYRLELSNGKPEFSRHIQQPLDNFVSTERRTSKCCQGIAVHV